MQGSSIQLCPSKSETLPVAIRMPYRLFTSEDSVRLCLPDAESALLFSDIITVGSFVAFCYLCDLILEIKSGIYFKISVIGFGTGLVATFITAYLTQTPQPALLYLVPFTTIPVICVSYKRDELKVLWEEPQKYLSSQTSGSQQMVASNNTEQKSDENKKDE